MRRLDSWLSPDEELLRLYDRAGVRRLTADEAVAARPRANIVLVWRPNSAEWKRRSAAMRRNSAKLIAIAALEAELRRIRGVDE